MALLGRIKDYKIKTSRWLKQFAFWLFIKYEGIVFHPCKLLLFINYSHTHLQSPHVPYNCITTCHCRGVNQLENYCAKYNLESLQWILRFKLGIQIESHYTSNKERCVYVYIYMCVHICLYTYVCIYAHICIYTHICVYICIYTYVFELAYDIIFKINYSLH